MMYINSDPKLAVHPLLKEEKDLTGPLIISFYIAVIRFYRIPNVMNSTDVGRVQKWIDKELAQWEEHHAQ